MKKYIKYLFLLIWTLVFIINVFIKGNYKNYNILSYIIIATIFSIPFIIIKLKLIKLPTKQKAHINNSVQPVAQPPKAFSRKDYPEAFLNNEYRIITESIEIIQNTKNIETLCERYKLAMKHALIINDTHYIEELNSNCMVYISSCYHKCIDEISSDNTRENEEKKFIEVIVRYFGKETATSFLQQQLLDFTANMGNLITSSIDIKYGGNDIRDIQARRDYESHSANPKFHRTFEEGELSIEFIQKYQNKVSVMEEKIYNTAGIVDIDMHSPKFADDNTIIKLIKKCDTHINEYEKCKMFCYSKGKGGQIYFQDMWEYCHNSQNECFGYADDIIEYRKFLEALLQDKDRIITNSLEIIENTNNIDELCKYYDIALKHAADTNNQNYISELSTKHLSYILDCYDKYIGAVKTEKAKQNRKIKFFETLNNYLDKETIEAFDDMLSN